jgi:hypothetical protein
MDDTDSFYKHIALFFLQKSFSLQYLFSEMLKAWNMKQLVAVEKIGDYIFKLEFNTMAKKNRVLAAGLWRHKGDALIVVQYDGLVRPSKINIQSLSMWVCFYDLPPAMLKEVGAMQLGGQLGKYIKIDYRYLCYMRLRVYYPLEKPLKPQLMIKIKGCGLMPITLCYKNVSHFCFTCGRIVHAAMNCDNDTDEEPGVKYGEELHVSPPRRVKEITVSQPDARIVQLLFQVTGKLGVDKERTHAPKPLMQDNAKGGYG